MQVNVTFRHMESSDALRRYAEEKSARIGRFLAEPVDIHWVLSVEKIRHIADATVTANGVVIKAQEATQDMYSSIDEVLAKLYIQVKKHKDRVKEHKSAEAQEPGAFAGVGAGVARESGGAFGRVIKRENSYLKPMTVEEAAMELDDMERDFLIFTDCDTGNVSVIYRKRGGDLGLIETRTAR